jgi:hypothetical protein
LRVAFLLATHALRYAWSFPRSYYRNSLFLNDWEAVPKSCRGACVVIMAVGLVLTTSAGVDVIREIFSLD